MHQKESFLERLTAEHGFGLGKIDLVLARRLLQQGLAILGGRALGGTKDFLAKRVLREPVQDIEFSVDGR